MFSFVSMLSSILLWKFFEKLLFFPRGRNVSLYAANTDVRYEIVLGRKNAWTAAEK